MQTFYQLKILKVVNHLCGKQKINPYKINTEIIFSSEPSEILDFSDVKGQESVKRAIEVAAAGAHNLLLIRPSWFQNNACKTYSSILPDLTFEEAIDITKIYSVSGLLKNKGSLITKRPFRSPHHTVSATALTGGGRIPKPGEISLAHNRGLVFR